MLRSHLPSVIQRGLRGFASNRGFASKPFTKIMGKNEQLRTNNLACFFFHDCAGATQGLRSEPTSTIHKLTIEHWADAVALLVMPLLDVFDLCTWY